MKTAYKREYLNVGADVDLDFAGPTIHGAAVAGYEGWLAGYQMTFDTAKSKMTQSNFAVGYKTGDFQLHTNVYVLRSTNLNQAGWVNCDCGTQTVLQRTDLLVMVYLCQVRPFEENWRASDVAHLLLFSRNDGSEFGGSIYQKVNDSLETAVNLAWTAGSNGTRFGIAAKYQLDSSASISVSVLVSHLPWKLSFPSSLSTACLKNVLTVEWNVMEN